LPLVYVIVQNYKTLTIDNKVVKPGKVLFEAPGSREYDKEYKEIANKLDDVLIAKNPDSHWEACVKNFGWQRKNGIMEKFEAKNGRALLDNILPQTENTFKIFELKKNGFAINNRHHMNQSGDEWYYILPACVEGFHRDWEHDGICVKNLDKEKKKED